MKFTLLRILSISIVIIAEFCKETTEETTQKNNKNNNILLQTSDDSEMDSNSYNNVITHNNHNKESQKNNEIINQLNTIRFKETTSASTIESFLEKNYNENFSLNTLTSHESLYKSSAMTNDNSNSSSNTNSNFSPRKLAENYIARILKMRKKRGIVISRVFDRTPIFGELLALCAIEKVGLILTPTYLFSEKSILERYLIMLDINPRTLSNSSKLLLNMLLCNWRHNNFRKLLMQLTDGLCRGDEESIVIFKEILTSVFIDYLLKRDFYYQNDIEAKLGLINMFNSLEMQHEPILKIEFIDKFLRVCEDIKEKLTLLVLNLYPKERGK